MTEQIHWWDKQPSQVAYVSQVCSVEELETSPAVTQPRTSHHQEKKVVERGSALDDLP